MADNQKSGTRGKRQRKTHEGPPNGWTYSLGTAYHFEHFPMSEAEDLVMVAKDAVHVVETVNWSYTTGLNRTRLVHRNKYFTFGLLEAVGLAAYFAASRRGVAEDLVSVRPATDDEADEFLRVTEHMKEDRPVLADNEPAETQSVEVSGSVQKAAE